MYKKTNKKGALELSMNTIVIIVIGVTLLILGLAFVRGIFTKIGGLTEGAFEKAEGQIGVDANLQNGINVIPPKMDITPGAEKRTTIVLANKDQDTTAELALTATQVGGRFKKQVECYFVDTGTTTTKVSVPSAKFKRIEVAVSAPTDAVVGPNACSFKAVGFKAGEETGTLQINVVSA